MDSIVGYQSLPVLEAVREEQLAEVARLLSGSWQEECQALLFLRAAVKTFPSHCPDILARFLEPIYQCLNSGKPLAVKNCLALLGETFILGKTVNIERMVQGFLPLLLKKWSSEIGSLKELVHHCVQAFADHCGYECSFVIISQFCVDKNTVLAEYALRLLAKLVGNLGANLGRLSGETLQSMMKALHFQLDGKRANLKNFAKQIIGFIYGQIGSEPFVNMLRIVLSPEEADSVLRLMMEQKSSKSKDTLPLATALKMHRASTAPKQPDSAYHPAFYNGNY